MPDTDVKVKHCVGCGQPMHQAQFPQGLIWVHDTLIAEHLCWRDHRDDYEMGRL